jgi:hypothetical protein
LPAIAANLSVKKGVSNCKLNSTNFYSMLDFLEYLVTQFEIDTVYSEKEVNQLLNQHHTFGDAALLRRELFERGLIDRKRDGSEYWRKIQN